MSDLVKNDLAKEDVSPFHQQMLVYVKDLVKLSRQAMTKYYTNWDSRDETYRAKRSEDKEDKRAKETGAPTKMVVPLTYAQVQTFVAFCISLYYQRSYMFELQGNNVKGHVAAKIAEAVLQRDLNYNIWSKILYQFLLDIGRFGIGIIKHTWVREMSKVLKQVDIPEVKVLGMTLKKSSSTYETVEDVKFLGNKLLNISPFRFFPDTRLPLSRFQEGAFCASEDEYTLASLRQMEANSQVIGVDYVKMLTQMEFTERGESRFNNLNFASIAGQRVANLSGMCILTECQIDITPKDFLIDNKPIGPETTPVKYVVSVVNDNRIVQCQPMGYMHNMYTYDVAQFSPDQHQHINESICEMTEKLQDVINWFVNSHISSVRKTITNQFVVDPAGVEIKDFTERKPLIRLKSSASRTGVDRWIKQLQVQDVTQGHMADAEAMFGFIQIVTGINENALGQFHGGRRSATEARVVNMAAASRLKLIAKIVYDTAIEPLGRKLISNHRDGLDVKTFVRMMGNIPQGVVAYNNFVEADKTSLIGDYDFEIFDGTLPTEKMGIAQIMQEVLTVMLENPLALQLLGIDPRKLFNEMMYLKGVKNMERFYPDQPQVPQPDQTMMPPGTTTPPPLTQLVNGNGTNQPAGTSFDSLISQS